MFREIFRFREDKNNNVFREILKCFRKTAKFDRGVIGESFCENLLIKLRNQNIFEKVKRNLNLQTIIPFKMIYNVSMLCRRFSNERCESVCVCGGGGGGEG